MAEIEETNQKIQNQNPDLEINPSIEAHHESQDTASKAKSRLFVPATLLFCLPLILLLNQISVTLKFPDFYSYTLLLVGGAFSCLCRNHTCIH